MVRTHWYSTDLRSLKVVSLNVGALSVAEFDVAPLNETCLMAKILALIFGMQQRVKQTLVKEK